jgi:hypothetical protein
MNPGVRPTANQASQSYRSGPRIRAGERITRWSLRLMSSCLSLSCNSGEMAHHDDVSNRGTFLELSESVAVVIPKADHIIGARFLTREMTAYWTPNRVKILADHVRPSSTLCEGLVTGPRSVTISTNGALEVLDRSGILRVLENGACLKRLAPRRGRNVSSGTFTHGRWVWIEEDSAGVPSLVLANGEKSNPSASRMLSFSLAQGTQPAIVAPSQAGYAIVLTRPPYSLL